jgi:hypothetical protein
MNTVLKSFSIILAAGTAGVTLAEFAGLFPTLPFRGEATLIAGVSASLLFLLVSEYSRRPARFQPLAPVVRPRVAPRQVRRVEAIVERAA